MHTYAVITHHLLNRSHKLLIRRNHVWSRGGVEHPHRLLYRIQEDTKEGRMPIHNEKLLFSIICGEGGIRTHGTRKGSTVFETARFNHSRTSPSSNLPGFPNTCKACHYFVTTSMRGSPVPIDLRGRRGRQPITGNGRVSLSAISRFLYNHPHDGCRGYR